MGENKVALGQKYECPDCDKRVYDLGRPDVICPSCGQDLKAASSQDPGKDSPKSKKKSASSKRSTPTSAKNSIET